MNSIRRIHDNLPSYRNVMRYGCNFLVIVGIALSGVHNLSGADIGSSGNVDPAGGKKPEIVVQQPAGSSLVDGSSKKSFGTVVVGSSSKSKTFKIINTGKASLNRLRLSKVGVHVSDYSLGVLKVAKLAPGDSTTFKVTFKPTAKGVRRATLRIFSNDSNENPFDIMLTGQAVK